MRKYLLLSLAIMVVLVSITGILLIVRKDKSVAGTNIVTSLSPQYPKIEKYQVPILMYHYIRNAGGETELGQKLSVSPTNFHRQIKKLKDEGFETIRLVDLADPDKKGLSRVIDEGKKPLVITFDDGYVDAYTQAFPILKQYGYKGTFFIIRDFTGRHNRLSKEQIDKMQAEGMEIGSHTLTHPDLSRISISEQRKQIFDSKGDTNTFCYPGGKYNSKTVSLVKEMGYLAAVTTKIGVANETSDLLELPRVRVENVSPEALLDKITYAMEHS